MIKIAHQDDRPAWLEARKRYCTASDAAAALGASKYKTREEAVAAKVAEESSLSLDSDTLAFGLAAEPAIRALARDKWGWRLEEFGWLLEDPRCSDLAATPDCIMQTPWGAAVVDLKITTAQAQDQCRPGSTAKFAGGCPLDFAWQLQAQMSCLGREFRWAAVLVMHCHAGFRLRSYCIRRSEAAIDELHGQAQSFMSEVRSRRAALGR